MDNLEMLSDKELYEKCCFYGAKARKWMRRFAALLPEVERRQLYKKRGFHSIFEFAAKLAGMNHETVRDILRIAKKLEDKPLLQKQIAKYGWSKLRLVATIATKENEKILAEKVETLSKPTLEIFIKELKKQNHDVVKIGPGTDLREKTDISQSGGWEQQGDSQFIVTRIPLRPKTELRLKELQRKLSKKNKGPVNLNEVMETLLDAYEKQHGRKGREVKKEVDEKPASRYIPVRVKRILREKYQGRCAYPRCNKLPDIYHHTRRFALFPNHDPDFLAPLCKSHERLAHLGLIENEEKPTEAWRIQTERDKNSAKFRIDQNVNAFRKSVRPAIF